MKNFLIALIAIIVLSFSIYQYQEVRHLKTQLFSIPIVTVEGNTISKIFKVDHNALYSIHVNFEGKVHDEDGKILYNSESPDSKRLEELLDLKWTLKPLIATHQENKAIVENQSKALPSGFGYGESYFYDSLGDFKGIKGDEYLLEVTVLSAHPKVNLRNPTLTIGMHYTVIESHMWAALFYLILGLASALIAVSRTKL